MSIPRIEKVWIWGTCVSAALCIASPPTVRAEAAEYALDSRAWNGLSELVRIARELSIEVRAPARIDLGELREHDGLLVIYPAVAPPANQLAAFMTRGGRLAVADDFGAAEELLQSLGATREAPPRVGQEQRLRGNPNLLIATAQRWHPLSHDVNALLTNHPRVLRHPRLLPIFGFERERSAVVLGGSVGAGRVVAIGDPSVLINNMLEFRGNRAFARNLVRFLAQQERLWIATPQTRIHGQVGSTANAPLPVVRGLLQRIATLRLPDSALRLTSAVMAIVLLIAAASALPRRSAYRRAVAAPEGETFAGYSGRVRLFARPRANLLLPALTYKQGFEQRLVHALRLPAQPDLREVAAALRSAGLAPSSAADAERLLLELQALHLAHERGNSAPRVSAQKFHALVAGGERILAALGERRAGNTEA